MTENILKIIKQEKPGVHITKTKLFRKLDMSLEGYFGRPDGVIWGCKANGLAGGQRE